MFLDWMNVLGIYFLLQVFLKRKQLFCKQFAWYNTSICLQRANNGILSVQNEFTLKRVCKGREMIPIAESIHVSEMCPCELGVIIRRPGDAAGAQ